MAGRPKRRAMIEELEKRTRSYFEVEDGDDNPHSILDYVVAETEQGVTLLDMSASISTSIAPYSVGREWLSSYLHKTFPDANERLTDARTKGSHAMVEQAIQIVDAPVEDKLDVAQAASRARARQWTAERYNSKELGQSKQQGVTVNIGTLHLDALRSPLSRAPALGAPQHTQAHVSLDAEGSALSTDR